MLRGKRSHKPKLAYDLVRIHSLMVYADLIEYNIVCDSNPSLLNCDLFISKLEAGDSITTGQYMYMNYHSFSNLQFTPRLKKFFHSVHIDLKNTSGEKKHFVAVGISRFLLMFRKTSNTRF